MVFYFLISFIFPFSQLAFLLLPYWPLCLTQGGLPDLPGLASLPNQAGLPVLSGLASLLLLRLASVSYPCWPFCLTSLAFLFYLVWPPCITQAGLSVLPGLASLSYSSWTSCLNQADLPDLPTLAPHVLPRLVFLSILCRLPCLTWAVPPCLARAGLPVLPGVASCLILADFSVFRTLSSLSLPVLASCLT
jgi:hypothetical protein